MSFELEQTVNQPAARGHQEFGSETSLVLQLDGFAWKTLTEESVRLGVSIEELAKFAVLYYFADLDSGRIARQIPPTGAPAATARPDPSVPLPDPSVPLRERRRG
jgi:hypothetical protein